MTANAMTAAVAPAVAAADTDTLQEPVLDRFLFFTRRDNTMKERDEALIVWFGALSFFLSTIEYLIPKPLPFLRLGLANLPLLLAASFFPMKHYLLLVFIKILGQGLTGGTLFSYIFFFSAAGTISSALIMKTVFSLFPHQVSHAGVSALGAFISNVVQLILARFYIFGISAWYIAPPFMAVGLVSGFVLGAFANAYYHNSRWFAELREGKISIPSIPEVSPKKNKHRRNSKLLRLIVGGSMIGLLLTASDVKIMAAICTLAITFLLLEGSTIHVFPVIIMSASIIFFNLLVPSGKILWEPFYLQITEGALFSGIKKALLLEGMIFLSRWMLKPGIELPGITGKRISRMFTVLALLLSSRKKISPRNIVASIDDIMYGLG